MTAKTVNINVYNKNNSSRTETENQIWSLESFYPWNFSIRVCEKKKDKKQNNTAR